MLSYKYGETVVLNVCNQTTKGLLMSDYLFDCLPMHCIYLVVHLFSMSPPLECEIYKVMDHPGPESKYQVKDRQMSIFIPKFILQKYIWRSTTDNVLC